MKHRLLYVLLAVLLILAGFLAYYEGLPMRQAIIPVGDTQFDANPEEQQTGQTPKVETYSYKKHGFTIDLPKGFTPQEVQGETGPTTSISLPVDG